MTNILLVGFGGFIGSVMRYLASGYVQQTTKSVGFPYGTLAVNVIGCFVIGFLAQLAESRGVFTSEARLFVFVGILGGFTTYSALMLECLVHFRADKNGHALLYLSITLIAGLFLVWLGARAAEILNAANTN